MKTILILLSILSFQVPAYADTMCNQIDGFVFCNDDQFQKQVSCTEIGDTLFCG